jgi:hypothetical protein
VKRSIIIAGMPQQMLRKLMIIDGKTPFFLAMLAVVLIAAGMWLNVSRTTIDGTFANYEDQGDPYSERIVRNTVQNSLLGVENKSGSLIMTRGYFEQDVTPASKRLDYHADGTRRYHSQFGAQAWVYTRLAAIFGDGFAQNPDTVFQMLRFANCLLLATCFATFFAAMLKRRPAFLAAAALMSVSGGAALFSFNLYFMYWMMFTPLLVAPLLFAGRPLVYLAAAFIFGLAQFLVRYEFATTFALMWLLPVVLARHDRPAQLLRLGAAVFAAVCASFVAAVMLHHLRVRRSSITASSCCAGWSGMRTASRSARRRSTPASLPLWPRTWSISTHGSAPSSRARPVQDWRRTQR